MDGKFTITTNTSNKEVQGGKNFLFSCCPGLELVVFIGKGHFFQKYCSW